MPCCDCVGAHEICMASPSGACMEFAPLHRVVQLAGLFALLPKERLTARCNASSTD